MRRDELCVEELLCNDAAKIVIDEEFKNDLKNRLMFGDKYNNVTELPKRKDNFKKNRYLKIASGFVICVVVSGTMFKTIGSSNKSMLANNGEAITPIATSKDPKGSNGKNTNPLQPKVSIIKDGTGIKPLVAEKDGKDKTTDKPLVKNAVDKSNGEKSDAQINDELVKGFKNSSPSTEVKGPIDIPEMDVIDDATQTLKCYDSRYSFDEKSLLSVKGDGIYVRDIESSKEKKLISCNENTHIVDKPNFTPSNEIIYYKAEKITLENGIIGEKNGAIYICDKNGQESAKIVDGKNPMISKDGKKLVYEAENKIYILTFATNNKRLVDTGKYPAWADNGNLISYVKEDIEKGTSSLWVFDLLTASTRSLTNNEENIKNDSIESWAESVRSGNVTSNLNVTSGYSYFESIWSSSNKEIYVIRENNKAQVFDFIKFKLD